MVKFDYGRANRHAENKLTQRYNEKDSKGLLKKLRAEILNGNFNVIAQTTDGIANGFVKYKQTDYFLVYNSRSKRILTLLPPEAAHRYK